MAKKPITYERLIKRDRKYKFMRFLFTLMLLFAGVLFIRHVDARLAEYEITQPVNVLKSFLLSLDQNTDEASSYELSSSVVTQETLNALSSFAEEQPLDFKEVVQPKNDEHHYNLLSGNEVVALVQMKERLPGLNEHYNRWDISSIELIVTPERLALKLLKDLQSNNFSYIVENTDPALYPSETDSDLNDYLIGITEDKEISLSEGEFISADEKEYIYLLDGEPFFSISEKKDAGTNLWHIAGSQAHFIKTTIYTATIPAHLTLYVNEKTALESWISGTSESKHASRVASDVINPVDLSIRHYEIPFTFSVPEFSVKDSLGNDHPFTLQGTELVTTSNDSRLLPEFSSLEPSIKEATEKIADFFVGQAELGHLLKFVERDSAAYDVFFEYIKWNSLKAGITDMESCEIKSMTKLGDNCFVVDVSGLFKAHYTATNIIDYPLNYTLYYHTINGVWYIYDFINN